MSSDKYTEIRVEYTSVTNPLGLKDLAIISRALGETGGFDGRVIAEVLFRFGVNDKALENLKNISGSKKGIEPLDVDDALNAFLLCCLTSAALGEEELSTITGYDRDEIYTTIRRLYHIVRKSIGSDK